MVPLLAAAIVSLPALPSRVSAAAQATATIRIVRAVRLKFDGSANEGAPSPTIAMVHVDGGIRSAKLIEFQ